MKRNNEETNYTTQQIFVNEIVFAAHEEVHLFGFALKGKQFIETKYIAHAEQLNHLLLQSGKTGRELCFLIEEGFTTPHSSPFSIDLIDLFGTTQILESEKILLEPSLKFEEVTSVHNMPEILFVQEVSAVPGPAYF